MLLFAVVAEAQVPTRPNAVHQNQLLEDAVRRLDARLRDEDTPAADRVRIRRLLSEVKRLRDPAAVGFNVVPCSSVPYVLDQVMSVTSDTVYACPVIVLGAGLRMRVEDATVFFRADEIQAATGAAIDGHGAAGAAGARGEDRGSTWNSRGDSDYWDALNSCRANPGHPDRGGAGEPGGNGRGGARIVFAVVPVGTVVVATDGGVGGPGGLGGNGRLLRNGRNYYCDGCTMNCPVGPPGPSGGKGEDGFAYYLEAP